VVGVVGQLADQTRHHLLERVWSVDNADFRSHLLLLYGWIGPDAQPDFGMAVETPK
jgi:hypothetical protein